MLNLFSYEINNWDDWSEVFQSIYYFEPIIKYIFHKEKLPFNKIEKCQPGTNAVFKVGNCVIKIFAPKESGIDNAKDYDSEVFMMDRMKSLDIPSPKIISKDFIDDKYRFLYIIMQYIDGIEFSKAKDSLSFDERLIIGQKLRQITDKINIEIDSNNNIEKINKSLIGKHTWSSFDEKFKTQRLKYINSKLNYKYQYVLVHGDLNGDNIVINNDDVYILDFADTKIAPVIYEYAVVACELFKFNKPFMEGFFGDYNVEEITDICFNGLLIHDFGGHIITDCFGPVKNILSLDYLKNLIYNLIADEKRKSQ